MKLPDFSYEWDAEKPDPLYIRAIYWILEATRKAMNFVVKHLK